MNKIISDDVENNKDCSHVFILFEDGELIMTKGGKCFRQRSFFPSKQPLIDGKAPAKLQEKFDNQCSGYYCAYFNEFNDPRIEEYRMLLSRTLKLNYK